MQKVIVVVVDDLKNVGVAANEDVGSFLLYQSPD